jgi:cobalt-zinc-cadmium efflux system outer membrane protein
MPVPARLPGLLSGCVLAIVAPLAHAAIDVDAAVRLALAQQPLLDAQQSRVAAARSRASAAGELPDPELVVGLQNLSVERPDPWAADAEPMTMTEVGVMQAFPNRRKRSEQARSARLDAERLDAEHAVGVRTVVRDTTLAWIDAWQAQRALALVERLATESDRLREATLIAQRSGGARQDASLAAELASGLIDDRRRGLRQTLLAAQARLGRWTGVEVDAVSADLPLAGAPPSLDAALEQARNHPELQTLARAVARSEAEVGLARAAYRPDWRVQAMYGHRRPYDDMFSVQIGVDLPLFNARRQDPMLASASAERAAAEAQSEDGRRSLLAEVRAVWHEHALLSERVTRFEQSLLPAAALRIDSAVSAYAGGDGSVDAVFDARLQALDIELQALELRADRARLLAQLRYLTEDRHS